MKELKTSELISELESRGYFVFDYDAEQGIEIEEPSLSYFTTDDLISHLIENEKSVNLSYITQLFSKAGQRMQYSCLCDLFGVSHLSPKADVLQALDIYFDKIK